MSQQSDQALMTQIIKFLRNGPADLETIVQQLGVTRAQFRSARYGYGGELAMVKANVCIPRPIAAEGWVYKITDRMGKGKKGADLNLAKTYSVLLAQQTTLGIQVKRLLTHVKPPQHQRDLQGALGSIRQALGYFDQLVGDTGGAYSEKTLHLINQVKTP
jgi:hypothetical protein